MEQKNECSQVKTVVVGAGVIGLSIAVALADRGAEVTVVDTGLPGNGTSSTSYAWINSNNKEPISYFELNRAGMQAHHDLVATIRSTAAGMAGESWLEANGHLEFATDLEHRNGLDARSTRLSQHGYAVERISRARACELIPDLIIPPDCESVAYFAEEAHCFPSLYIAYLLSQAARAGVRVRDRTNVVGLQARGEGALVALSDGGALIADRVVSAAGRWTNDICALAGVAPIMVDYAEPGDATVGYLAVTNPLPVTLNKLVTSPRLNIRPDGAGRLRLQALELDATADPTDVPSPDSPVGREFLARLHSVLRNSEAARIERLEVGRRAMPKDGYSVIGTAPDAPWLYLVATHSGVTLAPVIGPGVAAEIFGIPEPLFAEFRPDRLREPAALRVPAAPRTPGEQ